MGVLKGLPVVGKDLLQDTPVPCGYCQHPRPPSQRVGIVAVPWLYHGTSALSTLPQCVRGLLHHRSNCLQINNKKCNFLCYAQSALRADSKRGSSGSFSTALYQ